jgi:hypothetical protein
VFYQDQRDGLPLIRFCFAKADELLREAGQRLIGGLAGAGSHGTGRRQPAR